MKVKEGHRRLLNQNQERIEMHIPNRLRSGVQQQYVLHIFVERSILEHDHVSTYFFTIEHYLGWL